jgi:hypothetical protein
LEKEMASRFSLVVAHSRAHLAAVDETYFEHLRFAATVAAMLAAAAVACLLHALVPAWCTSTASRTIRQLHALLADRSLLAEASSEAGEAIGFTLLLALGLGASLALWLLGAAVALPLSLIALGLPLACLAANPELQRAEEATAA